MLPILRRVGSRAHSTARRLASYAPQDTESSIPLPDLILSTPAGITPRLVELGLDCASAQQISGTLLRFSLRLKESCEADFRLRRQQLQSQSAYFSDPGVASRITATYLAIYTRTLEQWRSYILSKFVPRFIRTKTSIKKRDSSRDDRRRPPFNPRAVPLLEASFDKNAFPTKLDKHELAVRCNMTYRQIDVWFQNHRTRSRREGKELKKLPSSGGLINELENIVIEALLPMDPEEGDNCILENWEADTIALCDPDVPQWNLKVPDHAYPAAYPPQCSYEPFPVDPSTRNLRTPWPRKRGAEPPARPPVDMSDLVASLARLNMTDTDCDGEMQPEHPRPERYAGHVRLGFAVRCPLAPLPALVRQPIVSACSTIPSISSTDRSPRTRRAIHHSNSGTPPPIHPPTARVKRTLPRRAPQNPPTSCAQISTDGASAVLQSYRGCSPSRASLRSSSSKSSLSSNEANSPLVTPTLEPCSLPAPLIFDAHEGFSQQGIETSSHIDAWISNMHTKGMHAYIY